MTYFGDDEEGVPDPAPERGRGARVVTWVVVAALALIAVNIGIATVGGQEKAAPTPAPVVTARPTAAAPTPAPSPGLTSPTGAPSSRSPSVVPSPAPFASTGIPATLPFALVAVTERGDIELVDPDSATVEATLVTHEPGASTDDLSVDGRGRVVYFDRLAACPTVWTYSMKTGRVAKMVAGRHPVISPDGKRLAVVGTGCGPGGQQAEGLAIYDARTRAPLFWAPLGDFPTTAGHLPPATIVDVDWLPDGSAVAVTVSSGDSTEHHLLDVFAPARGDIAKSPRLPIDTAIPGSYPEIAYASVNGSSEVFMSGSCCADSSPPPASGLRTQSGARYEGTPDGPATSLTTNALGDLRYLASNGKVPGELCGLGFGCRGGAFLRVDW